MQTGKATSSFVFTIIQFFLIFHSPSLRYQFTRLLPVTLVPLCRVCGTHRLYHVWNKSHNFLAVTTAQAECLHLTVQDLGNCLAQEEHDFSLDWFILFMHLLTMFLWLLLATYWKSYWWYKRHVNNIEYQGWKSFQLLHLNSKQRSGETLITLKMFEIFAFCTYHTINFFSEQLCYYF